jgi:outer membrane protein assembly factor BamD
MVRSKSSLAILLVAGAASVVAACAGRPREEVQFRERPVEQLYQEALRQLDRKYWAEAATAFDEVERQHPYTEWARRAILMSAYASYQANKYDDAIAAAQRFLTLHPGNRSAPYAYYLIAMCQFEQILDVGRDQNTTVNAKNALLEVERRFPASDYARDARLKLDMVDDQLAGKEMEVGRYYLRRDQYIAAANRFKTVISDYQTTSHTPEALYRLVETYLALGVTDEATAAGAVLGYNFPGSPWYADAYRLLKGQGLAPEESPEKRDGWWRRAIGRVL